MTPLRRRIRFTKKAVDAARGVQTCLKRCEESTAHARLMQLLVQVEKTLAEELRQLELIEAARVAAGAP